MDNFFGKTMRILAIFFVMNNSCISAVVEPPEPSNKLSANITVGIEQNQDTQLYTYTYNIFNDFSSVQSLESFMIETIEDIDIVNAFSPEGWRFDVSENKRLFAWTAVGIDEAAIPDVWDGNVLPSAYQIKPGEQKSGFVLQTYSLLGEESFYVQGFTRLAVVDDAADLADEGFIVPTFPDGFFQGTVKISTDNIYLGNRRPGVDGFLGFVNLQEKNNEFRAPVVFRLKFAINGETVNQETFKAMLNKQDVTPSFIADPADSRNLVGTFEILSSPLKLGRNVLTTSVDGEILGKNGSIRTATDVDRIAFTVIESDTEASSSEAAINFDSLDTD